MLRVPCHRISSILIAFIVNHGPSYTMAALASWFEFWCEASVFGSYKRQSLLVFMGFFMVVVGQVKGLQCNWLKTMLLLVRRLTSTVVRCALHPNQQVTRTLGMVTCGENFNHQIMEKRTDTHKLVTTGVYS